VISSQDQNLSHSPLPFVTTAERKMIKQLSKGRQVRFRIFPNISNNQIVDKALNKPGFELGRVYKMGYVYLY